MDPVRAIDFDRPDAYRPDGRRSHMLYYGESCIIICTLTPAQTDGPPTHVHTSDQYYFVVRGEITIKLGMEIITVPKHGVIYIPAGVPHHNWNATDEDEVHVEIIAPGTRPGRPLSSPSDHQDATGYYTRELDEGSLGEKGSPNRWGMTSYWFDTRERSGLNARVYVANIPAHASGPSLHIHQFDQFYLVLEGELDVEVGLSEFKLQENQLVVLPAGVAHRQWNSGKEAERHLTILAPAPPPKTPEHPWDISVELNPAGVKLLGSAPGMIEAVTMAMRN